MKLTLVRIILYVQNVRALTEFYRDVLGLLVVEEIDGEWTVLQAGQCQLALHRAGEAHRGRAAGVPGENNNAKIVLCVEGDLEALREELIARGVPMRSIRSYPPSTALLCDGNDPEGNVFQLAAGGA